MKKDITAGIEKTKAWKLLKDIPLCYDWCEYKGEVYFAQINTEATEKANKAMFDLSYCATKAMNQIILKTVQWDKNKFKPSKLGNTKW